MLAFHAEHALMAALSELFLRVIHSTTSMLMSVSPAVLVQVHALQALSLKADKVLTNRQVSKRQVPPAVFPVILFLSWTASYNPHR